MNFCFHVEKKLTWTHLSWNIMIDGKSGNQDCLQFLWRNYYISEEIWNMFFLIWMSD